MEDSKICLDDFSPDQTMIGVVIEELTNTVKQELPEEIHENLAGIAEEIKTVEETVTFYEIQYFNKSAFESEEDGYRTESRYNTYGMKVGQNECDSSNEFTNTTIPQSLADVSNEHEESPVHCEEDVNFKYEDLETMNGEVIEEHTETVKEESPEEQIHENLGGFAHQGFIDFNETRPYFNQPAFVIEENGYGSESKYVMKVEQNGSDRTPHNEVDITCDYGESVIHCKEEDIDIKYEDLETELTTLPRDKRYNCERKGNSNQQKRVGCKLSLVHKSKSEVGLYKCKECSYSVKQAGHLKKHMFVHKAKSEVDLYKCKECSYAAKRADHLKQHMLVHKAQFEVHLYKCHECSYATKRAGHLKRHMFVHKAKSELDLYRCTNCSYAAKQPRNLKHHMLVHKAKSEIDLYKCKKCSYGTKYAANLKKHMLVHVM